MSKPFRWNIQKYEQLGRLIEGKREEYYSGFTEDLIACCSRLISFSGNSDLVFIGRSPESIFDFLSGLLSNTLLNNSLRLVNISIRNFELGEIEKNYPRAITALKEHLADSKLSPADIIMNEKSTILVDLVYMGLTFGYFTEFLFRWASEEGLDIPALRKKLGFIGITERKKTSPNTWRWQQKVDWVKKLGPFNIKNVSIPWRLWDYLGNNQNKVSFSNPPWRWADENIKVPPRQTSNLEALRLSYDLVRSGRSPEQKLKFSNLLSKEKAMKEDWFRSLIIELRRIS